MGLDTTHNAWHGPYSSFGKFREKLAEQIGINLKEYAGYLGGGTKDLTTIDHDLMPLFNHSDCDGELSPAECQKIANGLLSVINNSKEEDRLTPWYASAMQFRDGCLDAISKNESIEFH